MALMLFFKWWYGNGWSGAFKRIITRAVILSEETSLKILASTLFEPWKQIITYSPKDSSLDVKFHTAFDNLFARCFGFVIRSATILISIFIIFVVTLFGLAIAIIWPVIPILPFLMFYLGLT